jgi:hypothetical protein
MSLENRGEERMWFVGHIMTIKKFDFDIKRFIMVRGVMICMMSNDRSTS